MRIIIAHCLNMKHHPNQAVINLIRMSIVIIVYLVLIILCAVKSISHNPILFQRSKVDTALGFTVHLFPRMTFLC